MHKIWLHNELGKAVSRPRIHYLEEPDILIEKRIPIDIEIQNGLRRLGHTFKYVNNPVVSSCQAIYVDESGVYAKSDPRKMGHSAGY